MEQKKLYVWQLASFLAHHDMRMSGEELAAHLNRNNFLTNYGTEYAGGRGIYRLIDVTWHWLTGMNLHDEARKVATAFVKPDGSYAYDEEE